MERALDLSLLGGAIGGFANLPTPNELRQMIADAEVNAFFAQAQELPPGLIETAWALHQVGTVRPELNAYEPERQVQANSVAAHIFDLTLARGLEAGAELVTTFAAQVSSIRGDRTPNASALARRLPAPRASVLHDPGRASLELGCSVLSLNRAGTVALLRRLEAELALPLGSELDNPLRQGTALAAAASVVRGSRSLLRYLAEGTAGDFEDARAAFAAGATDPAAHRDLDSRWVAAHLLDLTDDLGTSSVWAVLPDGTPPAVGRAMTLGDPPVMTLWPPQISLLTDAEHSPLNPAVRRSVMTFPTSAGKTLLSQLIVAHHLAIANTPVCFVAPSHSLCREIRQGLDRRLWVLRKAVAEDGPLGDPIHADAPVVVMTPERLAARLRSSSADLLDEFGLFVLDEAHLVGDDTRGWTFESTISRLHELTRETDHRMVVVSAALGGTATVRTWLDVDDAPEDASARWRGPRRLHATYETAASGPITIRPKQGSERVDRRRQEMFGVVRLFVDAGAAVAARQGSVGFEEKYGSTGHDKPSTAEQLSLVVNLAARSGSVLTVHATKVSAVRLAEALAATRDAREPTPLVRLAEQRLGAAHPLVGVLAKGVAYHHAALPVDVQIEIENAVRSNEIEIVCATTTLTEGVNLPVRTVIIASRGFYDGTRFVSLLDAAGLLNAAGRAGRAGRETEGWVIVAREPYGQAPRQALLDLDRDTDVQSTLCSAAALAALGEYEALVAATAGLVFDNVPVDVDGFLGYCWYLAESSEALAPDVRAADIVDGLRRTLAWQQLTPVVTARWEALAQRVAAQYEVVPAVRRRRWAITGTRLSANLVLERVSAAARPGVDALPFELTNDPLTVLQVLLAGPNLDLLLSLVPERDRRFKRRRYGATVLLDVDLRALVLDWVAGLDLPALVERYLADVEGEDADAFSFEQLSSFLSKVCEHHLPWTTGIITDWLRQDSGVELCPSLPAHLHYGLPNAESLSLMTGGIRSRRLAVTIGQRANQLGISPDNLRNWLAQSGATSWRSDFEAAPAELGDLLQFVRLPGTNVGQVLLEGTTVTIQSSVGGDLTEPDALTIAYQPNAEPPAPLVALDQTGEVQAEIHPSMHHDLCMLVNAGFPLLGQIVDQDGDRALIVRLVEE